MSAGDTETRAEREFSGTYHEEQQSPRHLTGRRGTDPVDDLRAYDKATKTWSVPQWLKNQFEPSKLSITSTERVKKLPTEKKAPHVVYGVWRLKNMENRPKAMSTSRTDTEPTASVPESTTTQRPNDCLAEVPETVPDGAGRP